MKLKFHFFLAVLLLLARTNVGASNLRLDPLWSNAPGGSPLTYLDTANFQRGMAYNPKTDHLLIVDRNLIQIHIVDAQTGADLGNLIDRGFAPVGNSSFPINMIGVDDDGAIYVGNLSNSTSDPRFALYRWESETATNIPVFGGSFDFDTQLATIIGADPGLGNIQRWGDTMDVRGSGTNVQVLLGSRGSIAAILRPTDSELTNFASTVIAFDSTLQGPVGYTAKFGPGNTIWGAAGLTGQANPPAGSPLRQFSFSFASVTNGTATVRRSYTAPPMPTGMAVVTLDPTQNLMGGLAIGTPDTVNLFSIEDLQNNPVLFDSETIGTDNANSQWAGSVCIVSNHLYVLDANNGISAYTINIETDVAPTIVGQPVDASAQTNSTASFSVVVRGSTSMSYQWYKNTNTLVLNATNSTLTFTNLQVTDAGTYRVVVSNSVGTATSSDAILNVTGGTSATAWSIFEPFNYSSAQTLTGKSLGSGPSWDKNGSGDETQIAPGNLSVTGLVGPSGNCITNGGSGSGARLILNTNFSTTNFANNTLFYSFAMRVDTLGASFASGFIAAFVNNTASSYGARLACKTNNGTYLIGVARSGTGYVYDSTPHSEGETVFIVGSYTFNPNANDDVVKLWINPSSSTFGAASAPAASVFDTASGSDLPAIDQFTFRQTSSSGTPAALTFDELRLGTTWPSVTPFGSSEPAAPPTLAIVNNGNGTANVTWPSAYTTFGLQSNTSLSSTNWASVPSSISGTNNLATVSLSGTQFLRLKK